jgi:hypothetical protein
MFFLKYWDMLSGGALGALCVGLVASNLWERGAPTCASLGPSFVYSPERERGFRASALTVAALAPPAHALASA